MHPVQVWIPSFRSENNSIEKGYTVSCSGITSVCLSPVCCCHQFLILTPEAFLCPLNRTKKSNYMTFIIKLIVLLAVSSVWILSAVPTPQISLERTLFSDTANISVSE